MSDDFNPPVGLPQKLDPLLRRVVAPNPSAMTYRGTNTYLLGDRQMAVIDPGPASDAHLSAILKALGPQQEITHIIVTHSHKDHSPLAGALAKATGAPVVAFGNAQAGRSDIMAQLAANGLASGGEGVDKAFQPDQTVADGETITTADWQLTVRHTPGHLGNHICLQWEDSCFTGDHVMGWASSLVSPPDGDLSDFMSSCRRLNTTKWRTFYPGHGDLISLPNKRLDWLLDHRLSREAAILRILLKAPCDVPTLTRAVYTDTPAALLPAAERNVLAHLIDLYGKSRITTPEAFDVNGLFTITPT